MSEEADRLIGAALRDHARIAAPPHLRRKLERRYLRRMPRWLVPSLSAVAGAALAALVMLVVRPAPQPELDVATEAVGDHLRVLGAHGLDVETNDMHNVKPWFAGKLDFTPPVTFVSDDEFQLKGGDVAVFLGHKSAAFIFAHRLHVLSLFVFESGDASDGEKTIQGFHVATWGSGGLGFALVSDINWDDLRALEKRLREH
jgi:anti-sigma factor RsiW